MTIHLNRELEERIRSKVRAGSYRSEDDVIEAALTLLDARDALDERELDDIRAELDRGLSELEAGRYVPLSEVLEETEEILGRHGS
jgi:putative addiction module CopG family antidote